MELIQKLLGRYYWRVLKFVLTRVRPIGSIKKDLKFEECIICGNRDIFRFNSWIIDKRTITTWKDDRFTEKMLLRESLFCQNCGSSTRTRSIIKTLLKNKRINPGLKSNLIALDSNKNIKILLVNQISNSKLLQDLINEKFYCISTFFNPGLSFGIKKNSSQNEDILDLTFESNYFDIVIHSDVLEHVRDWEKALLESTRVLKKGGMLYFTTPINTNIAFTTKKFYIKDDEIELLKPVVFHGRAGGIFSIIQRRNDYIEMYQFGNSFFSELCMLFESAKIEHYHLKNINFSTEVFTVSKD